MALPRRRFSLEENTITGISDVSCASNRAKRRPATRRQAGSNEVGTACSWRNIEDNSILKIP
jgi:hypothetical protein